MSEPAEEGYDGPATLLVGGEPLAVQVSLRGLFQPIDGRYHWYGRIASSPGLDSAAGAGATVSLHTPHGRARARLSDVDPWGRFRVSGTGSPPFRR